MGSECVDVSGSDRGLEAGRVRGRGVRPYAAADAMHRFAPIVGRSLHLVHAAGTAAGTLGEHGGALGLPQLDGARLLGGRFVAPAGGAQRRGERQAGVGVVQERVGRGGDVDGGPSEFDGVRVHRRAAPAPRRARGAR